MASGTIHDRFTWKLIGSVTGQTSLTTPANFEELLLVAQNGGDIFYVTLPAGEISSTYIYPRQGNHLSSTAFFAVTWRVSTSDMRLEAMNKTGSSVLSSSEFRAYYR